MISSLAPRAAAGHVDGLHPRRLRSLVARLGILEDQALGGRHAHLLRREQEHVGRRLAVHDIVGGDDDREEWGEPGELERMVNDIVRPARRAFEESHDPFILDAALDRSYYEGLEHRAMPLESIAGQSFRRLMSSLIDRLNLVWLMRYRFNYKLPPAQVYFLLVASRYTLSSAQLRKLATLGSQEEVLSALPESLRGLLAGVDSIPEVFARMEHGTIDCTRKVLHAGGPAIARAFAYLILREHDLRAVRAVLRGRLLGLPEADIRLAMFHPAAGSA